MFDGEIVKQIFPLKNILDLEIFTKKVQEKVQEKVGLRKFSPIFFFFFFCKKPKMSCLMEKL